MRCENFDLDDVVLKNRLANFNHTSHKAALCEWKGPFESQKGDHDYELWYYHE